MEINKNLRDQIFQVVEQQIILNNPPETKITYDRLVALGYSKMEAYKFIGQCVSLEIFSVIKEQKPFNEGRYINNLKKLPEEPFEGQNED